MLWIALGSSALLMALFLLLLTWESRRAKHPAVSELAKSPGWERNFIGLELPTVRNEAGDEIEGGPFPYAGSIKIRLVKMGTTRLIDQDRDWQPGETTEGRSLTLTEWEVTSECDVFIYHLSFHVEFLDSWGKVIADCYSSVSDVKPFGRQIVTELVTGLPREKLHRWQLAESRSGKMIFRPTASIQRVEGSNTLAEVTMEIW